MFTASDDAGRDARRSLVSSFYRPIDAFVFLKSIKGEFIHAKEFSLRSPWLFFITVLCLAAWAFGPQTGFLKARNYSAQQTAMAAVLDDDNDCDDHLFATLTGSTIGGQMPPRICTISEYTIMTIAIITGSKSLYGL